MANRPSWTYLVIALFPVLSLSGCGQKKSTQLEVNAPTTTLRVGETVQLTVIKRKPDGTTENLTDSSSGTTYYTTGQSRLIPEPDGRVTAIGTDGRDRESAVILVGNGELHGHIRFKILPPGPGPSLVVTAEKTVLQEGEQVPLHISRLLPDGGSKDLTPISTGTRYFTFSGDGVVDQKVVEIKETGLASATRSIGNYKYRTVIVFVRNADLVGWIELKVIHANS